MDISAFRGFRYDTGVVGDAGLCIAPPYDVIDQTQQGRLYEQSEYNIIRIIKGRSNPDDNETNNVYTRAAEAMNDFIKQGALRQDDRESIYVYSQDFTIERTRYRRTGFIALGKVYEYGGPVRPHEQTLAGPKADRLNLTRATQSQFGQIFMLYSDSEKTIDALLARACEQEPLLSFTDEQDVTHQLYVITDRQQIQTIQDVMRDRSICIADGHHRYETALNYYKETKNPLAAYAMMTFVNTYNEGLIVLPTHRLIKNVADFNYCDLTGRMNKYFDVARLAFNDVVEKEQRRQTMLKALQVEFETGEHAIGMYFNDGAFYVATLRDITVMDELAPDKSTAWRQLDVAILHKLILEKMLGIDEAALTAQTNVEYIKDFGPATLEAIDKVDEGYGQGLFFLNPTRASEVEEVAQAGEKMPQKSTFFYPKIFSGLVFNKFEPVNVETGV